MSDYKLPIDTARRWDTGYTAHGNNFIKETPTEVFIEGRPILEMLMSKKMVQNGGERLVQILNTGGDSLTVPNARGQQFSFTDEDPATACRLEWATYVRPVVITQDEEDLIGPNTDARFNMVEMKVKNAIEDALNTVNTDLLATSYTTGSGRVLPITQAIADDPTTTGYGGIAATAEWWRNKTDTGGSFATNGSTKMRTMFNTVSAGGRFKPSMIFTDQTYYEKYEALAEARHDITTGAQSGAGRKADIGFGSGASYKGVGVGWDLNAPASKMYYLNSEGIQLVFCKSRSFELTPFESLRPSGVDGRGAIVRVKLQLAVLDRRRLGVIEGWTA